MSFWCSLYGLRAETNEPIPGVAPIADHSRADLQILLGLLPDGLNTAMAEEPWYIASEHEDGVPSLRVWRLAGGQFYRLLYADNTEFVVESGGTRVWCRWPESLTLEDTATYLLGPVMGFVLLLRGIFCLHASAIVLEGKAVAIVGPPGYGKSTIAAAFAKLGYPFFSDDVVTLHESNGDFLVQPAYPRIRLWPKSAEALYGFVDALPRITPTWDKRYVDLTENGYRFQASPLPLAAIYVLKSRSVDSAAPRIESLRGNDALFALARNTYVNYLMDKTAHGREFETLSRVIASVPVRRAFPHAVHGLLPQLCKMILEDFQTLTRSGPSPQPMQELSV